MTIKQQTGFGVVPITVIIATVLMLGFIGYKVYSTYGSKSSTNNSEATKQASPTSSQSSNTQKNTASAPADSYLHIKELGIKLKLSGSINDVVYSTLQPQATEGAKVIGISAQSLIDASKGDKRTDCSASSGALGLIRATTTAPTNMDEQPLPVDNKTLFKLGNTYYQYVAPQQICGISDADHEALLSLATQKQAAIAEAIKTIQLDN